MYCSLLVGLLLLSPAGVLQDDKIDAKLLVGKWKPEKKPENVDSLTIEFTKDKVTLNVEAQGQKQTIEGTYKVDGSNLVVTLTAGGNTQEQKRKITKLTKDELVTKDEASGEERKYKKAK